MSGALDASVKRLRAMFLLLCEARELADETRRKADPAGYLRARVTRLVVGDRLRAEEGQRVALLRVWEG